MARRGHSIHIAHALATNGSLVSPQIARLLAEYDVRTTVSVDGPADSNDCVRMSKKFFNRRRSKLGSCFSRENQ